MLKYDQCHHTWLFKIQVCLLPKLFSQNIACSDYMSNINFGNNIECEHWYYKVKFRIALKAHTESVHEVIGQKKQSVHLFYP